jgi:hypothetical protein
MWIEGAFLESIFEQVIIQKQFYDRHSAYKAVEFGLISVIHKELF